MAGDFQVNKIKYWNPIKGIDCVYSVDMLRLNFDVGKSIDNFVNYIKWIAEYNTSVDVKDSFSSRPHSYKYLWSFKTVNCAWAVGMDLGNNAADKTKGFIEFNPNKCMNDDLFVDFIRALKNNACIVEFKRADIAIDYQVDRSLIGLERDGKRIYQCVIGGDGSRTEYSGLRSHHGFVKLYDKTAESKLKRPLSRLEITTEKLTVDDMNAIFPKVVLRAKNADTDDLTQNDRAILALLSEVNFDQKFVQMFNWAKRKKLEPYFGCTALMLDDVAFLECVANIESFTK